MVDDESVEIKKSPLVTSSDTIVSVENLSKYFVKVTEKKT